MEDESIICEIEPRILFLIDSQLWLTDKYQTSFKLNYFPYAGHAFKNSYYDCLYDHNSAAFYGKVVKSAFAYPTECTDLALFVFQKDHTYTKICPDIGCITNVFRTDKLYVTLA